MGERKVLNRYVPPDFDPKIIPKFKRDKFKPSEVRTMLPFSMRCETCGEYMGRGKKFNSRKEYCQGEDYMKIRRWRFLVKCCVCNAEISFKTDPKSTDYEIEYGAVRNFEVWKENDAAIEEDEQERGQEDEDAMKSLENRTLDSKLEMDVLDTLDEIKAMNQRHERVDTASILRQREERVAAVADEALVQSIRFRGAGAEAHPQAVLSDDEDEDEDQSNSKSKSHFSSGSKSVDIFHAVQSQLAASKRGAPHAQAATATVPAVVIKKKKKRKATATATATDTTASTATTCAKTSSDSNHCINSKSSNGVVVGGGGCGRGQQEQGEPSKRAKVGDTSVLGGLMLGYGSSSGDDED